MGCYVYGVIFLINLSLIILYLNIDSFFFYAIDAARSIGRFSPNCLDSWSNASLEYREVLSVVALQSLLFSLLLAGIAFLRSLAKPELYSRRLYKAGPVEGVLIGVIILWIWYCWMGSDSLISFYSELGFVSRRLFDSPIGITVVALTPNLLGLGVGIDVGRIFSN